MDEAIDKTIDGKPGKKNGAEKEKEKEKDSSASEKKGIVASTSAKSFTTYSKFDFIPGETLVAVEDFSKEAIGDFPVNWNTNAGGEVVTMEGREGRWLKLLREGVFHPEFIRQLPENFTLEFDLVCTAPFSYYSTPLHINLVQLPDPKEFDKWGRFVRSGNSGARISVHPTNAGNNSGSVEFLWLEKGKESMKNEVDIIQFHAKKDNTAHISIWRQHQRVRIYIDEEKAFDLPRAIPASTRLDALLFSIGNFHDKADHYLVSNIRVAVGAPDTRNKLIKEGRYVTTGILFDVNSDKIKPESYGTLKELALVLKEHAEVHIRVVGHTDNDGEENTNLELSKKRAASVKNSLVQEFGIDAGRIQTDGKGESQPVGDNTKAEGKAQNRRVEFIKIPS